MPGISTLLVGPYDSYATHDKTRLTCGVPDEIQKPIFEQVFTRRGAQDKILARLFHVFVTALNKEKNQARLAACITQDDRESVANDIINEITDYDHTVIPDYTEHIVNPASELP